MTTTTTATIGSGGGVAAPQLAVGRRIVWVYCPLANTGAIQIGDSSFLPGYNGPGTGAVCPATFAGAANDKVNVGVGQ